MNEKPKLELVEDPKPTAPAPEQQKPNRERARNSKVTWKKFLELEKGVNVLFQRVFTAIQQLQQFTHAFGPKVEALEKRNSLPRPARFVHESGVVMAIMPANVAILSYPEIEGAKVAVYDVNSGTPFYIQGTLDEALEEFNLASQGVPAKAIVDVAGESTDSPTPSDNPEEPVQ